MFGVFSIVFSTLVSTVVNDAINNIKVIPVLIEKVSVIESDAPVMFEKIEKIESDIQEIKLILKGEH